MFKRIRDGLEEGAKRYGSRLNEMVDWECPKCGNKASVSSIYDEKICMKDGCGTKMVKASRDNADRDMADYAKCAACGHEKGLHLEGGSKCYTCGCAEFKNTLKNAKCPCGNEINPRSRQPFAEPMCDECIAEEKQYAKGERDYERENAAGEKCASCGHAHDGDVCDDCKCTIFSRIQNDAPPLPGAGTTLGYDYGTSTTTMTPGESCRECGHTLGQKFYDTNCHCRCHAERANNLGPQGCPNCGSHQHEIAEGQDQVRCLDCGKVSDLTMWNTVCDICRKEEGAGLEEHLTTRHGLEPDVAAVVAEDMESIRG